VYGTYFLFGSFCVVMAIYTFFLVPETKGIMLESMPELFQGSARKRFNPHGEDISDDLNESGNTSKFEEQHIERSAV
jgi:hypothetical protein